MKEKQERVLWLDVVRTIATLAVVFCHAAELAFLKFNINEWENFSLAFRTGGLACFTIGRMGVPLFLFLSGYLILNKPMETEESVLNFYKRKAVPLLVTVEAWNVLYYLFQVWYFDEAWSTLHLAKQLLFLEPSVMSHMWYMPVTLGLYIVAPFLGMILRKFSTKVISVPLAFVFVQVVLLGSVYQGLKIVMPDIQGSRLVFDMGFFGTIYGLYFVLGYFLYRKELLGKWNRWMLAGLSVFLFVGTVIFQYVSFESGIAYNVWYDFLPLVLCMIFMFELFRRMKCQNWNRVFVGFFQKISAMSLGLYFFHKPIQFLMFKTPWVEHFRGVKGLVILFVVSGLLSLLVCEVIVRIKGLRKLLLRMS